MRRFAVLILTINSFLFSQQTNDWKNFSSFSDIYAVAVSNESVWASSSGGAFGYSGKITSAFTKSEGLSSQFLTSIITDNGGNIWLGSEEGYINILNPLNGSLVKIYDIYTSNNDFKSINYLSVSGDTVFASTDFGLSLISSETFEFIETAMKFGNFNSKAQVLSAKKQNGKVYVCTAEGLAVQKPDAASLVTPDAWNSYSFASISATQPFITEIYNDTLFIGTDNGVFILENGTLILFGLANKTVPDLFTHEGTLYALTNNSLFKYTGGNFIEIYHSSSTLRQAVVKNSSFFIASDNGLIEYANNEEKIIVPNAPFKNLFSEIAVDKTGTLWVATGISQVGLGIFKYDGNLWELLDKTTNPELPSNSFYMVYVDNDNIKYFMNWGDGFISVKNGKIKVFDRSETGMNGIPVNPNYIVTSGAAKDSRGNLWIINYWSVDNKPLNVLTPDSVWYHFSQPLFSPNNEELFSHIVIDQYNTKWFADISGHVGLLYFNENGTLDNSSDDEWGMITETDGLASSSVQALAVDNYGELWVGTSKGLNVIPNPSSPRSIMEIYALHSKNVTSILVDPLNNKWVGTVDGVYYLSADGYSVLAQFDAGNSPLPDNKINDITFDNNQGKVYFATDHGISSFKTNAIEPRSSFEKLFLYPNPFVIGKNGKLTIDELAENSYVKIFTVAGKLVASVEGGNINSPGGRIAFWDGTDLSGEKVASGIYIVVAYNENGSKSVSAKIAVIRE